ncbi:MAG TPA: 2-oxoacid:acceptor oxidoreductase family protein [Treponemataceae bacterium]|jgi:2-oxoglutarate ferredoxin oxidoreductase subunit gamma|nr:MAG: Pyruvate synthase subunit PorC [Spirochaetes bacterium ADurb.Bin269]HOC28125.1 2-oxoacid:acceptor oxidoreductase family protein [Treponemataceae bacterium]HPX47407.1 2-oxoacid:acceptor oxidoreductase family protein [Treponemataceae bacterium]HQL32561.1 2-oxoacid:acceptor oxidoreductase family protein [Treponemataceae bacterium]
MIEKTVFYGFGGQGIISLGQIWAYCGMKEGLQVSFFPFYGAEKRGGIARANCIISSTDIASPNITCASSVVVMNQDSLAPAASVCASGGLLMVNSSLVADSEIKAVCDTEKKTSGNIFKIVAIPATEMAAKLGNAKIANMVMLGAAARYTGALILDSVQTILESFFPPSKHAFIPLNVEAIRAGVSLGHL